MLGISLPCSPVVVGYEGKFPECWEFPLYALREIFVLKLFLDLVCLAKKKEDSCWWCCRDCGVQGLDIQYGCNQEEKGI